MINMASLRSTELALKFLWPKRLFCFVRTYEKETLYYRI